MRYHGDEARLGLIGSFRSLLGGAQFCFGGLMRRNLPLEAGVRRGQSAHRLCKPQPQFPLRDRALDGPPQPAFIDMIFYQVVLHTKLHRVDGNRFIAMPGDQHEGRRQRAVDHNVGQKFQTGDVGKAEIQQHTIECCSLQCADARRTVGCMLNVESPGGLAVQEPAIQAPVGFIVVNDQQAIFAIPMRHDDDTPWHRDTP